MLLRRTEIALMLFFTIASIAVAATLPTLPGTFNTAYSAPVGGDTHMPLNGAQLSALLKGEALNGRVLKRGDVIVLKAGSTYAVDGNFTLPKDSRINVPAGKGNAWIYIVSSGLASLPEGKRVGRPEAPYMATIAVTGSDVQANGALATDFGAHHFRLCGIEITTMYDAYGLVWTGYDGMDNTNSASTTDQLPSHIWFDRCYIHDGNPRPYPHYVHQGLALNGTYMAVFDSSVSGIHFYSSDGGYSIYSYQGSGPYKIVNNFLEASGINIMIGSTGPKIFGSVPSDIDVRGNYFYKQPNWMGHTALSGGITAAQTTIPVASTAGFPDSGVIGIGSETIYYGSKDDISFRNCTRNYPTGGNGNSYASGSGVVAAYTTKNFFELKQAQRVLLEGNLFENILKSSGGQSAVAISLKSTNPDGTSPFGTQDVTVRNNKIFSCGIALAVVGSEYESSYGVGYDDLTADQDHSTAFTVTSVKADFVRGHAFTTATAAIGGTDTTIPVASSSGFSAGMDIVIDEERIRCFGFDSTHLTSCVRNWPDGKGGVSHAGGAPVSEYYWIQNKVFEIHSGSGWTPGFYRVKQIISQHKVKLDRRAAMDGSVGGGWSWSRNLRRLLVQNNAWLDVSKNYNQLGEQSAGFLLSAGDNGPIEDVTLRNNLVMHNGDAWVAWFLSGGTTLHLAARNLVYENNIQTVGNYKVFGSGKGSNLPSLNWYVSSWSWSRNVMVLRSMDADHSGDVSSFSSSSPYESNGTNYPSGSYGPNGADRVGFVNPGPDTVTDRGLYLNAYDFRLSANSPYHNAGTDAKDIGPDWDVLNAATASARNGGAAGGTAPAAPAKLRIATY